MSTSRFLLSKKFHSQWVKQPCSQQQIGKNDFTSPQRRPRTRPLRGEGRGLVPEKMEKKKEKRELRSPDGTEPDTIAGADRVVAAAQRATAIDGVVAPEAAAQQTNRAARLGSCGVGHAS